MMAKLPGDSQFSTKKKDSLTRYSGFDSALYRNVDAKDHFSQENDPSHDLQRSALESKPLSTLV
jgi:hypothetical protein